MAAFEEAISAGADFLELDLHLNRDGIPVVIHDATITNALYRRKDGKKISSPIPVSSLSTVDLKEFDAGAIQNNRFPSQKTVPGQIIPTLEDLLIRLMGRGALNVEIKREGPEPSAENLASAVVETLKIYPNPWKHQLQSFDLEVMEQLRRFAPHSTRSALFEKPCDFITESQRVGATMIGPYFEFLSEDLIRATHVAGLKVVPWTVNDPRDWERLIAWEVDGLITDYPRRLKEFLRSKT
ncbi:MAG: hypothetical protein HYR96_07635 [Deltaproteobacteria bacterium]|nr:hypothetical protein [Deltaproteobacteria bacterium]MBI3293872.1 hypothetical protein [Deltaproteobacteria bacterium]